MPKSWIEARTTSRALCFRPASASASITSSWGRSSICWIEVVISSGVFWSKASSMRSIALHQNPDSIELLDDDVFEIKSLDLDRARIYGLAKIRSDESLETLMGLMRKTDPRKVKNRMKDIRLALIILTHLDKGPNQEAWLDWWQDNKKTFEVPGKEPRLTEELANKWGRYWGQPRQYERQKRRGERGDDPEDDGKGGGRGRGK